MSWEFGGWRAGEPLRERGEVSLGDGMNDGVAQQLHRAIPAQPRRSRRRALCSPRRDEIEGDGSKPGDHLNGDARRLTRLNRVLLKRDVEGPMMAVLDAPVEAYQRQLLRRREVRGGNARDEEPHLRVGSALEPSTGCES